MNQFDLEQAMILYLGGDVDSVAIQNDLGEKRLSASFGPDAPAVRELLDQVLEAATDVPQGMSLRLWLANELPSLSDVCRRKVETYVPCSSQHRIEQRRQQRSKVPKNRLKKPIIITAVAIGIVTCAVASAYLIQRGAPPAAAIFVGLVAGFSLPILIFAAVGHLIRRVLLVRAIWRALRGQKNRERPNQIETRPPSH